jgi:hypothetical protein
MLRSYRPILVPCNERLAVRPSGVLIDVRVGRRSVLGRPTSALGCLLGMSASGSFRCETFPLGERSMRLADKNLH